MQIQSTQSFLEQPMDSWSPAINLTAIITGLLNFLVDRENGISLAVQHFPSIQKDTV